MSKRSRRSVTDDVISSTTALAQAAVTYHRALSARLGLGQTESDALDHVSRAGSLSNGELSEALGISPASVTGVIDRLAKKGFVARSADPNDGRRVKVQLAEGHARDVDPLVGPYTLLLEGLCAEYGVEELEVCVRFLGDLTRLHVGGAQMLTSPADKRRR